MNHISIRGLVGLAAAFTAVACVATTSKADTPMAPMSSTSMAPAGTPIDYMACTNPAITKFDLRRAKKLGFTDHQIAEVLALSDWTGIPARQVISDVLSGQAFPTLALEWGVAPSKLNNLPDYDAKLANLNAAFAAMDSDVTTGTKGWVGTVTSDSMSTYPTSGDRNIMATLRRSGNFGTLIKVLRATGLDDTLRGSGPYTLFAPTDAAFAKLPAGALDSLMNDKSKLTKVLNYHIISGRITGADAMAMTSPTSPATLVGDTLTVTT
jgi:uncharacterized surface protein with fasciclin (FAS1) repeats